MEVAVCWPGTNDVIQCVGNWTSKRYIDIFGAGLQMYHDTVDVCYGTYSNQCDDCIWVLGTRCHIHFNSHWLQRMSNVCDWCDFSTNWSSMKDYIECYKNWTTSTILLFQIQNIQNKFCSGNTLKQCNPFKSKKLLN